MFIQFIYLKLNVNYVISRLLFLGSLFFFIIFSFLLFSEKCYLIDYEVLKIQGSRILMAIYLDWVSCSFMRFVILISFVVVIYRKRYMGGDNNISMFIILVFSFVLSILLLIISPNLIRILLGWDGLGLTSYCLVIYYQNIKSYNAGMLTAITNRIGDVLILIGIAWILNIGRWNYLYYWDYELINYKIISVLIIFAAITKRAQIPFSSWLPAAMAAPTPVSALVHSSTLVTAGVYLLFRFNFLLSGLINDFLLVISVSTIFISGLRAIFEYDLKKIIALSTLSQLGLIIRSLRLGITQFGYFHLLTHALFKSLLFICAGYIIHSIKDCQDIRFIGCLFKQRPLLSLYFNLRNLALCGIPFLAGFYSKDVILENILIININWIIFLIYFLATIFTVRYTFRLIYYRMVDNFKLSCFYSFNRRDYLILGFIRVIVVIVILGGSFIRWIIFLTRGCIVLTLFLKLFTLIICFLGGILGYFLGREKTIVIKLESFNSRFFGGIWFMPFLATFLINWYPLNLGYFYYRLVEIGWGEKIGGQGLYITLKSSSKINQNLQEGSFMFFLSIYIYMIMILFIFLIYLDSL